MGESASIVVGGEALIDLVRDAASGGLNAHEGGGPYNTARTLARLGCVTHFLGVLSNDGFGSGLAAQLASDGVLVDQSLATDLPSTLAVAELDAEGTASYRFYTEGTSAPGLDAAAAVAALPADVAMLHVGTLGLVLEPLASALRAVVDHVAGTALVMVDLNCRPAAIADRDAYRSSLAFTLGRTDVVKASVEDLAWLYPRQAPLDAARDLLEHGLGVVLVTDAARGATALLDGRELRVPAPQVSVADTIGAGDAFGGGLLAWWSRRGLTRTDLADPAAIEEAVRFACLVAARTCERPGAFPPTLAELGPGGFGRPPR